MNKQKIVNSVSHKSSDRANGGGASLECLPKTFSERGISTPFTTKAMRYARLAVGHGGRHMISLPGLSGGLGTYELPLDTLRDVFDLSVHDRMLFDRLLALETISPDTVLQEARDVAMTGVGGVELARLSSARAKADKSAREQGQLAVLHQALRQLGGDAVQDMKREDLLTPEGQLRSRKAMNRFAAESKVEFDTIIDSLGEWAKVIAPVGLKLDGCEGGLRVLTNDLRSFAAEIDEWSSSEQSDFKFMVERVSSATRSTHDHAMRLVKAVDGWNNELGKVITHWEDAKTDIAKKVDKLWWLLDGWQDLLDLWGRRSGHDRVRDREIVEEIASFAPVLPVEEITEREASFWVDVRVNQMLWAAELRKLGSGEIDADMVDRLERFRRQSA
ncbi:hypothetical protein LPB41_03025 [Thalassospira sp. MA62]|nr:hypothetical protein [Thalassospira sp. MA62]